MREELENELVSAFPFLYENGFYFECGEGWFPLIRELSEKLYPLILKCREFKDEFDCYPRASQVKEKYGSLRFYMSIETKEMSEIIHEYENRSETTCEVCGKSGRIDYKQKWLTVRCDEHT